MEEVAFRLRLFGSPSLEGPSGLCQLTPFQLALLSIVCTEGVVGRARIARVLWRADPDAHTRQRIRQLVHSLRHRTALGLVLSDGDDLILGRDVRADVTDFEHALRNGRLLAAAELIAGGFLNGPAGCVSASFEDWRGALDEGLRRRLLAAVAAKWLHATTNGDWVTGRDAAESGYRLSPRDEMMVAMVIEARARVGCARAAEVAYSDFMQERSAVGAQFPHVEAALARARAARREASLDSSSSSEVPLIGRDDALARLRPALRSVLDGKFALATIVGEAGLGKSKILTALRVEAAMEGVRCLSATPVELERRISLNPILDALASVELDSHLSELGEPWRTVVENVLPARPLAPPVADLPAIDERNLSRRLLDAFALLLKSLAGEMPTIIFIDDLHWADATTLALLQFLRRRCEKAHLGVVATLCPEVVERRDEAAALLWDNERIATHPVRLGELANHDAEALLDVIGAGRLTDQARQRLLEVAGCHPLYLIEIARDYLAGRFKLTESIGEELAVPVSLRSILTTRMAALSPAATNVASVLAVGSRPLRLGEISALAGTTLDECVDAAEELRARGIVQVDRDRVAILHDLFRGAIYADLSEARRAVLHQRLAERLVCFAGDEHAGELTIHFERAGDAGRSIEYGWIAGQRAMSHGAMDEAAHFFDIIARAEPDPVLRSNAMARRAEALFLGRDIQKANPALELAVGALREVGEVDRARRLEVKRIEGLIEGLGAPLEELFSRLNALKAEAERAADWEAVALALDVELQVRHASGDIEAIQRIFSEMESVSREGSIAARAVCSMGLAMQVLFGDANRGLEAAHEAVSLTRTATSHRLKALLRTMAALQLRGRLALPESLTIVEEARSLAAIGGDVRMRFSIESNLAVALLDSGELDRAETLLARSTLLMGDAEMQLPRFNQANNQAELALARSDYGTAMKWFGAAEHHLGPATPPYARQVVSAGLGLCALELGELSEARRRESLIEEPSPPFYYDPFTLVAFWVKLLERRSDRGTALAIMADSAEALKGRLELAWLKINKLRLEKQIKWQSLRGAVELAMECRDTAARLGLVRREHEFHQFVERLTRPQ